MSCPSPTPLTPAPPATYHDLYAHFGNPALSTFAGQNIVTVPHEIAGGHVIHVQCHRLITAKLAAVFAALKAEGLLPKTYAGCYVVRNIRGASHPSLHSWGLALDFDADEYPLGSAKRPPQAYLDVWKSHDFFCGADFHHRKDPMHVEYTTGAI